VTTAIAPHDDRDWLPGSPRETAPHRQYERDSGRHAVFERLAGELSGAGIRLDDDAIRELFPELPMTGLPDLTGTADGSETIDRPAARLDP